MLLSRMKEASAGPANTARSKNECEGDHAHQRPKDHEEGKARCMSMTTCSAGVPPQMNKMVMIQSWHAVFLVTLSQEESGAWRDASVADEPKERSSRETLRAVRPVSDAGPADGRGCLQTLGSGARKQLKQTNIYVLHAMRPLSMYQRLYLELLMWHGARLPTNQFSAAQWHAYGPLLPPCHARRHPPAPGRR